MKKAIACLILMTLLIWMGLIFWFSGQVSKESTLQSNGMMVKFGLVNEVELNDHYYDDDMKQLRKMIRKTAHFSLFAVLSSMVLLFWSMFFEKRLTDAILPALIFAGLYAVFDEVHQYFIPGRTMSLTDVGIDLLGALVGVLACLLFDKVKIWAVTSVKNKKQILA